MWRITGRNKALCKTRMPFFSSGFVNSNSVEIIHWKYLNANIYSSFSGEKKITWTSHKTVNALVIEASIPPSILDNRSCVTIIATNEHISFIRHKSSWGLAKALFPGRKQKILNKPMSAFSLANGWLFIVIYF